MLNEIFSSVSREHQGNVRSDTWPLLICPEAVLSERLSVLAEAPKGKWKTRKPSSLTSAFPRAQINVYTYVQCLGLFNLFNPIYSLSILPRSSSAVALDILEPLPPGDLLFLSMMLDFVVEETLRFFFFWGCTENFASLENRGKHW